MYKSFEPATIEKARGYVTAVKYQEYTPPDRDESPERPIADVDYVNVLKTGLLKAEFVPSNSTRQGRIGGVVVVPLDAARPETVGAKALSKHRTAQWIGNIWRSNIDVRKNLQRKVFAGLAASNLLEMASFRHESPIAGYYDMASSARVRFLESRLGTTYRALHPYWFWGFWGNESGTIMTPEEDNCDSFIRVHRKPETEPGKPEYPEVDFELRFGQITQAGGQPKIPGRFLPGHFATTIMISEFISRDSDWLGAITFDLQEAGLDFLIIYRAAQWSNRWSGTVLWYGDQPCRFYNSDIFDNISLHWSSNMAPHHIRVVLNGTTILDNVWELRRSRGPLALDTHIASHRRHAGLYRMADQSFRQPMYNPREIRHNPLYRVAINDLGQAWSRKYGCPWDPSDLAEEYRPTPKNWCSEFTAWTVRQVYDFPDFPSGQTRVEELTEWFRHRGRYFSASHGTTIGYSELGFIIRPMYFAGLRDGGHAVFFLNWIDFENPDDPEPILPRPTDVFRGIVSQFAPFFSPNAKHLSGAAVELLKLIVREGKSYIADRLDNDPRPAVFDASAPINWFRAISGNSGNMVKMDYFPVIDLVGYTSFAEPHNCLFGKTATNVPSGYRERPWGDNRWPHAIDLRFPEAGGDIRFQIERSPGDFVEPVESKETWLLWRKRGSTHYEDGFGVTYRD